jgi:hypothetical protein
MKFARIIDRVAVDVVEGLPADLFHPVIAVDFVEVPVAVVVGSLLIDGDWIAPDAPPPVPEPMIQMAIIDFLRLFEGPELDGFNALEAQCNGLAQADYDAAREGDQAKMALVGFKRFLTFYNALRAGLIELNHAETIQGLSILVPLGVLTPARLARVLSGRPPE